MADWIVRGHKTLELRSWIPKFKGKEYVGPLVIVSSKKPQFEGLGSGNIEGVVMLERWKIFEESDADAAMGGSEADGKLKAWQMGDAFMIEESWNLKGQLRIYEAFIPKHLVEEYLVGHDYKFIKQEEEGVYRILKSGESDGRN